MVDTLGHLLTKIAEVCRKQLARSNRHSQLNEQEVTQFTIQHMGRSELALEIAPRNHGLALIKVDFESRHGIKIHEQVLHVSNLIGVIPNEDQHIICIL